MHLDMLHNQPYDLQRHRISFSFFRCQRVTSTQDSAAADAEEKC